MKAAVRAAWKSGRISWRRHGWRRFIAVEPFAMGVNRFLVLPAGARHVLKMSLSEINPDCS